MTRKINAFATLLLIALAGVAHAGGSAWASQAPFAPEARFLPTDEVPGTGTSPRTSAPRTPIRAEATPVHSLSSDRDEDTSAAPDTPPPDAR